MSHPTARSPVPAMSVDWRKGALGACVPEQLAGSVLLGACSLLWSDRGPLLSLLQAPRRPGDKGSAGGCWEGA